MAKCPKCGAEIDSLVAYSLEENKQTVTLAGEVGDAGVLDWSPSDVVESSCKHIDFECPECGKVLFSNDGDSEDDRVSKFLLIGEYDDRNCRWCNKLIPVEGEGGYFCPKKKAGKDATNCPDYADIRKS